MGRRREAVVRQKRPVWALKRVDIFPIFGDVCFCLRIGRSRSVFCRPLRSIFAPLLPSPDVLRAGHALAQRFRPRPARIRPPVRGCFIAYCALIIALAPFCCALCIIRTQKSARGKRFLARVRMTFAGVFAKGKRPTGSLLWGAGFSPQSGWSSSQAASALPVSAPAGAERRSRKRP